MTMKDDKNLILRELYRTSKMGMEAAEIILPKVKNRNLRTRIAEQDRHYIRTMEKTRELLSKEGEERMPRNKASERMLRSSIRMNTMFNSVPGHIAEMMVQGTVMGIISMNKALNNSPDDSLANKMLAEEFLKNEEKNIDALKQYL